MSKKNFVLLLSIFLVVFSSCVSKKKFLEMQAGRLKAEELSRKLNEENKAKAERIKVLIADFEQMKNELLENNALKDNYIDSLSGELNVLAENLNKQKESLQETSFTLDFEKQRLTETIAAKNKSLQAMQVEIGSLENELSEKSSTIEQKNFEIQKAKDENILLNGKLAKQVDDLSKLTKQLETLKLETKTLKSQMEEKEATILKLENNVKLLKKELGQ